jgi:hypothetical protein
MNFHGFDVQGANNVAESTSASSTAQILFNQGSSTTFIFPCLVGQTSGEVAWVDDFQVEVLPYATTYTDSSRAAETLTIPTANVFTKGSWTVELVYIPKTADNKAAVALWGMQLANGNWYRILVYQSGVFQATVYTNGTETGVGGLLASRCPATSPIRSASPATGLIYASM